jgi:hypothetical protein
MVMKLIKLAAAVGLAMLVIGLIYGVVWWFWLPHHPTPIERATLTAARPASLAARREQPLHRRDHVPYVQPNGFYGADL